MHDEPKSPNMGSLSFYHDPAARRLNDVLRSSSGLLQNDNVRNSMKWSMSFVELHPDSFSFVLAASGKIKDGYKSIYSIAKHSPQPFSCHDLRNSLQKGGLVVKSCILSLLPASGSSFRVILSFESTECISALVDCSSGQLYMGSEDRCTFRGPFSAPPCA